MKNRTVAGVTLAATCRGVIGCATARGFKPNVNFGERMLSCAKTGSTYYRRMPAGTYRFRLVGPIEDQLCG